MASILQGGKRPMPAQPAPAEEHEPMHGGGEGESRSTLVSHGDGTHHIEHEDGSQTDHEHIGHALMHLAGKHSDGLHHHAHSDGMGGGITSHTSEHGGEPEGPTEHANVHELHQHLNKFFNEEEAEPEEGGGSEGTSEKGKDY